VRTRNSSFLIVGIARPALPAGHISGVVQAMVSSRPCRHQGAQRRRSGGLLDGRALVDDAHLALVDDAHDVGFLHDQKVFAVDLDLGSRPFAEQDEVAGLRRGE
jgi:hypothetical protein